jgi:hypothetical protein
VARLVADRVRIDLRRPEPVEEPEREEVAEEREGARVVGVQDRVGAGLVLDPVEALGDPAERVVPGDRLEPALALRADAAKRAREPGRGIEEGAVVADRALAAEPAAAHGVVGVAAHVPDRAVALDDEDPAGVVAVPRAGREDVLVDPGRHGDYPPAPGSGNLRRARQPPGSS